MQRLVFHVNNSIKRYGTVLSLLPLKENVMFGGVGKKNVNVGVVSTIVSLSAGIKWIFSLTN